MSEVKPHLSYDEQISKLREKGCIINDTDVMKLKALCKGCLLSVTNLVVVGG